MSRSRVPFLTLSELAFTFLFALLILIVADWEKVMALAAQAEAMRKRAESAESTVELLQRKVAALEAQIPKQKELRSKAFPACREEPLTELRIIGAAEAEEHGQYVSLPAVRDRYADRIAEATARECRHRLIVSHAEQLTARDFDRALRFLELNFYLRRVSQ